METNKVKLLSNYQLFQLAQNDRLDEETRRKVHEEFAIRNISALEIKDLKLRYNNTLDHSRKKLKANSWNPFYTAFAWRRHFNHLALLKTQGLKSEVKTYQTRFYLGLFIYMLLFSCALLLFSKTW